MYFRLGARLNLNAGLIMKDNNVDRTLLEAVPLKPQGLALPWRFRLQHKRTDPLQPADFYPSSKLMSRRLIETLEGAGVDNLQLFDAEIVNVTSGEKLPGYQVVNIIGLVAAADPDASKSRPLANVQFFETLVIDEARAHGLLMFRLAESLGDIIIAEKVAKAVYQEKLVDVTVEPLIAPAT